MAACKWKDRSSITARMKIVVNTRNLQSPLTGVQRYTLELTKRQGLFLSDHKLLPVPADDRPERNACRSADEKPQE